MTTKNYTTNVNSINSNNNNELTYNSNCQDFSSNTNISKGKKPISLKHTSFEHDPLRFSSNQKPKKNLKNLATNINSKLSPENYVKPLYYLLNNQVRPINKQFLGFKDGRRYLYNNQYPYKNNGNIMFNTALNQKEENKDNTNSKHMSNASKKTKGNKNNLNNKSSKNNKNGKNDNNNKNNKNKNNKNYNNNNNIKDAKKLNELKNQKATLIQAAIRGLLARNKLYNSLSQYQKLKRDIKTLEKIKQYKAMFFNNLKEFKEEFIKNKNNINNISKNNKSKDNPDSDSLNDENNSDINSKNNLRAINKNKGNNMDINSEANDENNEKKYQNKIKIFTNINI